MSDMLLKCHPTGVFFYGEEWKYTGVFYLLDKKEIPDQTI